HAIFQKKKWVGNAIVLDEIGKHKPITFCVILTPDDEVKSVTVLTYREPVGSDIRKHRFMKQFANRRISDIPTIDDDIAPITGATLSSWAAVTAVKKALIVSPLIHP
ncbi:FMN-binding protein, partial [bacterium]|nr:FMN-binding protein [bacterium]